MAACSICSTHYLAAVRERQNGRDVYVHPPCPNEHRHATIEKYRRINKGMQVDRENREVFYARINAQLKKVLEEKVGESKKRHSFTRDITKKRKRKARIAIGMARQSCKGEENA